MVPVYSSTYHSLGTLAHRTKALRSGLLRTSYLNPLSSPFNVKILLKQIRGLPSPPRLDAGAGLYVDCAKERAAWSDFAKPLWRNADFLDHLGRDAQFEGSEEVA